jgi:hypothetical protein
MKKLLPTVVLFGCKMPEGVCEEGAEEIYLDLRGRK